MNGLFEILTTKFWMLTPDFLHATRDALERNLNGHLAFESESKLLNAYATADGDITEGFVRADDGKRMSSWQAPDEPYINIMYVRGVVTRNGGGCSYGSVDFRDLMKRESNNALCRGHVFYIDTPGGSASAINDFKQGIAAAKEKGLPVIAYVDGMCCSAGMYLASQCDERYYCHPKNQIGCIGVMAAFYTEKDGEKNAYTNETYHEIYDPESFEKNKPIRDIANEGDQTLLVEELAKLGVEFRADVKAACPRANDTYLHGKVFNAEEVRGILMNGQREFGDVIKRVSTLYKQTHKDTISNQNKSIEMDAKFKTLANLCGVESLEITEEGTYLNTPLLNSLTAAIDTMKAQGAEFAKKNEECKALAEQLTAKAAEELASVTAERDNANAALEAVKVELDETKQSLAAAEEAKQDALAKVEAAEAANAEQTDLAAQIEQVKAEYAEKEENLNAEHATALTAKDEEIAQLQSNQKSEEEQTMLDTIAKAGGKDWFDACCALVSNKHFDGTRFDGNADDKQEQRSKTQGILAKKLEEFEAKRKALASK